MNKPKLMIISVGRAGKDTCSEYLQENYNLTYQSSSEFVGQRAVYPTLLKSNPSLTWEDCFNDRHKHRALWYDLITAYNTPNLARLGTELLAEHDIYCGLRNIDEFNALKSAKKFNLSIWIDADERLRSSQIPLESSESLTITQADCDITIQNNSTLDDLYARLDALMSLVNHEKN